MLLISCLVNFAVKVNTFDLLDTHKYLPNGYWLLTSDDFVFSAGGWKPTFETGMTTNAHTNRLFSHTKCHTVILRTSLKVVPKLRRHETCEIVTLCDVVFIFQSREDIFVKIT